MKLVWPCAGPKKERELRMSTTIAKPAANGPAMSALPGAPAEVLTLTEAALFLRVSEADVLRMVGEQDLPGRVIETQWRFLKTALENWLQAPHRMSGKEAFLALAGVWKEDPDIDGIVREAYRRRKPAT